jgi:hypothetical protein
MRFIVCLVIASLAGCSQTPPVYMKNPSTGLSATCGPYKNNDLNATAGAMQEHQCIEDYKEQGYVRSPTPN